MSLSRDATVLSAILASVLLAACSNDSSTAEDAGEPEQSPVESVEFAEGGAKVDRCAPVVTEVESSCKLAFEEPRFKQCPDGGPGGGEVSASGVSCALARQLRLPVGAGGAFKYGAGVQEAVYRPWLARGSFTDPTPVRAMGWTCHKWFDPDGRAAVRHVCWSDEGGIVLFTVS